jgi:uncharacterized membrane protein
MIDTNKFYTIGFWVFIGIGVFNLMNLGVSVRFMTIFSVVSAILGIFFNFVIAGFFHYLKKQSSFQEVLPISTEEELKEELKHGGRPYKPRNNISKN